jgi:hypothetical protein
MSNVATRTLLLQLTTMQGQGREEGMDDWVERVDTQPPSAREQSVGHGNLAAHVVNEVRKWLDEAESSSEAFGGPYYSEQALRALRAVVELHSKRTSSGACVECLGGHSGEPCATLRAIELEVLGEDPR